MDNTPRNLLLLLFTSILFLSFSHAIRREPKVVPTNTNRVITYETREQDILDVFKISYNLHSNDSHLSNIMEVKNNQLQENPDIAVYELVLGRTTCTRDKSDMEECAAKINFRPLEDVSEGMAAYIKLDSGAKTCREFQSELANCPFNERKKEMCKYVIFFVSSNIFETVMQIKCQPLLD